MKILLFIFLSLSPFDANKGMPYVSEEIEKSVDPVVEPAILATPENVMLCNRAGQPAGPGKPYQVIINEIMADPNPAVMLPEAEYIELYNRSGEPVDLSGWRIVFGDKTKLLNHSVMQPGSFLIICDAAQESELMPFGTTLPVSGMPAIVNSGQSLILKNSSGTVIHAVTFSIDWFESSYKKGGGYSLEMIDPDNPCGSAGNWKESDDHRGGTPGAENAAKGINRDTQSPLLLRAVAESSSSVRLLFSESMDSASLSNPTLYSATRDMLHPLSVTFDLPDYSTIILNFTDSFLPDRYYHILLLDSLRDCVGNTIEKNAVVDFALPQAADSFDVVINEILFDASPKTVEFIELYNRSLKTIDLSSFSLALADPFNGKTSKVTSLKEHPFLLFPGGYVAITANRDRLPEEHRDRWLRNSVDVPGFFSLPDDGGTIILFDKELRCIDRFTYSARMHFDLLSFTEGISLERIMADASSSDPGNWHSAAGPQGYATPGFPNSQRITATQDHEKEIQIVPEVFSPDNDGFDDCITVSLNLLESGYLANLAVFDIHGNKIRTLSSQTPVGSGSCFIWDGRDGAGHVPAIGMYLLYIELYNPQGDRKVFKKAVTLARRLP